MPVSIFSLLSHWYSRKTHNYVIVVIHRELHLCHTFQPDMTSHDQRLVYSRAAESAAIPSFLSGPPLDACENPSAGQMPFPLIWKYTPSNILVSHWIHLFWGITWDVFDRDLRPASTCLDLPGPAWTTRSGASASAASAACFETLLGAAGSTVFEGTIGGAERGCVVYAAMRLVKKCWKCKKKWCTLR